MLLGEIDYVVEASRRVKLFTHAEIGAYVESFDINVALGEYEEIAFKVGEVTVDNDDLNEGR